MEISGIILNTQQIRKRSKRHQRIACFQILCSLSLKSFYDFVEKAKKGTLSPLLNQNSRRRK